MSPKRYSYEKKNQILETFKKEKEWLCPVCNEELEEQELGLYKFGKELEIKDYEILFQCPKCKQALVTNKEEIEDLDMDEIEGQ